MLHFPQTLRHLSHSLMGILLLLVVARLVWIDVHPHTLSYDTRTLWHLQYLSENHSCHSPWLTPTPPPLSEKEKSLLSAGALRLLLGACSEDTLRISRIFLWNEWSLMITVFMMALCLRLFTGSWLLAALMAVGLLSLTTLRHRLGYLSWDGPLMALTSTIIVCLAAYLFTKKPIYLLLMLLTTILTSYLETSTVAFLVPYSWLILRDLTGANSKTSSSFLTLKKLAILFFGWWAVGLLTSSPPLSSLSWQASPFIIKTLITLFQTADDYILLSFTSMMIYLAFPLSWKAPYTNLSKFIFWLALTMVSMVLLGAGLDYFEYSHIHSEIKSTSFQNRQTLAWWEPTCLGMGVLALWGLCHQSKELLQKPLKLNS